MQRKISSGETYNGSVEIVDKGSGILGLRESGVLRLGSGESLSASRHWLWRLTGDVVFEVFFDEDPPRSYHAVHLQEHMDGWKGSADHLCVDDRYLGAYLFTNDRIVIEQSIKGPKKDYEIQTVYSKKRLGSPDSDPLDP